MIANRANKYPFAQLLEGAWETDSAPVRNVDAVHDCTVLAGGPSGLAVALAAHLVDSIETDRSNQLRDQNVHGSTHTSTNVRRAARQRAENRVHHESALCASLLLDAVLDHLGAFSQTSEHAQHIPALLHRDDAQMVTLVEPVHKRLGLVVENATALWPVLVVTARSLHLVLATEQEMVVDQPLALLVRHGCVAEHGALERVALRNRVVHLLHHVADSGACVLAGPGIEREHCQVACHANTRGDDFVFGRSRQCSRYLIRVHVSDVLGFLNIKTLVVSLDNRIEKVLEVIIRSTVSSMTADKGRWISYTSVDSPRQRPLRGSRGHCIFVLFPYLHF